MSPCFHVSSACASSARADLLGERGPGHDPAVCAHFRGLERHRLPVRMAGGLNGDP